MTIEQEAKNNFLQAGLSEKQICRIEEFNPSGTLQRSLAAIMLKNEGFSSKQIQDLVINAKTPETLTELANTTHKFKAAGIKLEEIERVWPAKEVRQISLVAEAAQELKNMGWQPERIIGLIIHTDSEAIVNAMLDSARKLHSEGWSESYLPYALNATSAEIVTALTEVAEKLKDAGLTREHFYSISVTDKADPCVVVETGNGASKFIEAGVNTRELTLIAMYGKSPFVVGQAAEFASRFKDKGMSAPDIQRIACSENFIAAIKLVANWDPNNIRTEIALLAREIEYKISEQRWRDSVSSPRTKTLAGGIS